MALEDVMKLKVMNYNILHGFHSPELYPYNPPFELNVKRLEAGKKIVTVENPDILVLTEACFGVGDEQDHGLKVDYGKELGYEHYFHARRGEKYWGSAILSKFPITQFDNNGRGLRHHVRATLDVNGKPITVDIVHPNPSLSEEEKRKYFREILEKKRVEGPHIMAGDFNAISPQDNYDRSKMISGFRSFAGDDAESAVDGMLQGKALGYVLSTDLVDTYKTIHPGGFDYTIPTDVISKNKDSGMRMDFIFTSPDFRTVDAYVINNELTNKASDHHPTVAVLELIDRN